MILKFHFPRSVFALLALLGAFVLGAVWRTSAIGQQQPSAVSFGSGFSYQGFLRDDTGAPLNDTCDFTFRLYDSLALGSQVGGNDVVTGVAVSNGLFTVLLNDSNEFGAAGFNGGGRYLDITVQCSGDATATTLAPRQPLNPAPYALFAERFAGYENLIIVAKQGGDFTSVTDAVNAIGADPVYPASSTSNRYLIYVAPGVYEDEKIVMKAYVDIEGAGQGVTVLTANGGSDGIKPESATLVGSDNAELRHVTVENISSDPANWTFAIYTAANTTFLHVTGQASGGINARGMVAHNGGMPILKDVALIASGGSDSSTGLDIYLASVLADGLFVSGSGGDNAYGLYINTVSAPVKMENVTAFAFNGASETIGMYINASAVDMVDFDTTVSSSGAFATGIVCANPNSRLDIRDMAVTVTKDSAINVARGILAANCDLTLQDARVSVAAPSPVTGVSFSSTLTDTASVTVNQLDIQAASSASTVHGLYMYSTSLRSATGRINDVTIQATGQLSTSNSYGLWHVSNGDFQYQDLLIEIGGQANFMYGIKTERGAPDFQNVLVDAAGYAQTTVFGVELINSVAGGGVDNGRIVAENTGNQDAVGLKTNSPQSYRLHNISTEVMASVGVWGYDFFFSDVTATDLEAVAEGSADSAIIYGARCYGGAADIHNARLTAGNSTAVITPTGSYGMYSYNCDLTLSGSHLTAVSTVGSRRGFYGNGSSGAPANFIRGSYLSGATEAIRTLGYANLVVVDSQLDGGVTSSGSPNDNTTCTAVSHGSGTTFNFTAGPVSPCP